jgi:DNA-directed RNA polymerase beta subunit
MVISKTWYSSIETNLMSFAGHNPPGRAMLVSKQNEQAVGVATLAYRSRFDVNTKMLSYPQKPLVKSRMYDRLRLTEIPSSQSLIVGVITDGSNNQEDAFKLNKASIERGALNITMFETVSIDVKTDEYITELIKEYDLVPGESARRFWSVKRLKDKGFDVKKLKRENIIDGDNFTYLNTTYYMIFNLDDGSEYKIKSKIDQIDNPEIKTKDTLYLAKKKRSKDKKWVIKEKKPSALYVYKKLTNPKHEIIGYSFIRTENLKNPKIKKPKRVKKGDVLAVVETKIDGEIISRSKEKCKTFSGVIDKIFVEKSMLDDKEISSVKIRIRSDLQTKVGDKICFPYGQKGLIGVIESQENMPSTYPDGITPDIIINTTNFPSRMTMGVFLEMLTGKAAVAPMKEHEGYINKNISDFIKNKPILGDVKTNKYNDLNKLQKEIFNALYGYKVEPKEMIHTGIKRLFFKKLTQEEDLQKMSELSGVKISDLIEIQNKLEKGLNFSIPESILNRKFHLKQLKNQTVVDRLRLPLREQVAYNKLNYEGNTIDPQKKKEYLNKIYELEKSITSLNQKYEKKKNKIEKENDANVKGILEEESSVILEEIKSNKLNQNILKIKMKSGKDIEKMKSKMCDSSMFEKHNKQDIESILKMSGFNVKGVESMLNPFTGEIMPNKIYIGVAQIMRLKHVANKKPHARNTGVKSFINNQPFSDRDRQGGTKMGRMMVDVADAHGADYFRNERLRDVSDQVNTLICQKCKKLCDDASECMIKCREHIRRVKVPFRLLMIDQYTKVMGGVIDYEVTDSVEMNEQAKRLMKEERKYKIKHKNRMEPRVKNTKTRSIQFRLEKKKDKLIDEITNEPKQQMTSENITEEELEAL